MNRLTKIRLFFILEDLQSYPTVTPNSLIIECQSIRINIVEYVSRKQRIDQH